MARNRPRSRSVRGKPRLGDAVEQRIGGGRSGLRRLRATSSAIVIGSSTLIDSRGNQRRGALSGGVSENGRLRAPPTKIGTMRASACMAMRVTARKQPEGLDVRFDRVGQIDGEPALALQHAHQPAADEDMLGVEGDGAGKLAPRLQPGRRAETSSRMCSVSSGSSDSISAGSSRDWCEMT